MTTGNVGAVYRLSGILRRFFTGNSEYFSLQQPSDKGNTVGELRGRISHFVFLTQRCKGPQRNAKEENEGLSTLRSSLENEVSAFCGMLVLNLFVASK